MADTKNREELKWEAQMAAVSTAGVRPLTQDSVSVGNGAEGTYTMTRIEAKRAVIYAESSADTDIRFDLNETAVVDGFPLTTGVYFVVEAVKDEVLHFFNTTGSPIVVHIMEIR